jgi:hypothetical protein
VLGGPSDAQYRVIDALAAVAEETDYRATPGIYPQPERSGSHVTTAGQMQHIQVIAVETGQC